MHKTFGKRFFWKEEIVNSQPLFSLDWPANLFSYDCENNLLSDKSEAKLLAKIWSGVTQELMIHIKFGSIPISNIINNSVFNDQLHGSFLMEYTYSVICGMSIISGFYTIIPIYGIHPGDKQFFTNLYNDFIA